MNIITLFCEIDDFFLAYEKWVSTQCLPEPPPLETRGRPRQLHPSEVMTLLIAFHQSNYRTFKHFYLKHGLRLLARRVSTSGELYALRAVKKRSVNAFGVLPLYDPRGL